jgi:hypothetical protein
MTDNYLRVPLHPLPLVIPLSDSFACESVFWLFKEANRKFLQLLVVNTPKDDKKDYRSSFLRN